ncbi:MAG: hypothetical protein V4495_28875 [Pseudomonadota bacterium]
MRIEADIKTRDTVALLILTSFLNPMYPIFYIGYALLTSCLRAPWGQISADPLLIMFLLRDVAATLVQLAVFGVPILAVLGGMMSMFRRSKLSSESFEITDEGLVIDSVSGRTIRPWGIFKKVKRVGSSIFMLYDGGSSLLPGRVFRDKSHTIQVLNALKSRANV